jgi:hypothetical protein
MKYIPKDHNALLLSLHLLQLDSMRKQNETHNVAEQTTYQLRAQVENR